MADRARAAFVMAHGRQELLDQAVAAIESQVDRVLVLDNASNPPLVVAPEVTLLRLPDQPPNLAKWWNIGLDFYATWYKGQPYDLAILCDDAIVPAGWFDAVTLAMRESAAVAGSASPWPHSVGEIYKDRVDGDIGHRMCSWAFIVDGACPVRADESMHWWWFDTDFDFALRKAGGTIMIPGYAVPNTQPGHYTNAKPELGAQTGRDREAFAAKHAQAFPHSGGLPW